MSEIVTPGINEQSKMTMSKLKDLWHGIPMMYYGGHIRRDEQFLTTDSLNPIELRAITSNVNKALNEGSEVAVIDYSGINKNPRIQIFDRQHYLRVTKLGWLRPEYEDRSEGNFSTRLRTHQGEGLMVDVMDEHGSKRHFRVSWGNEDDQGRRIAILTHKQGKWDVVLDHRIEDQEGKPSWKINKNIIQPQ